MTVEIHGTAVKTNDWFITHSTTVRKVRMVEKRLKKTSSFIRRFTFLKVHINNINNVWF